MDKILIIDDELPIVETLIASLESLSFELLSTQDPEIGLQLFYEHRPFLVILDMHMLPISGLDFINSILKTLNKSSIRDEDFEIMILTGVGSKELMHQCRLLGIEHFLNKPIHINILRNTVQSIHQMKESRAALKNLGRVSGD